MIPAISGTAKFVLGAIASVAGILAAITGNELSKSIVLFLTGKRPGKKPTKRTFRLWFVFLSSATVTVIFGSFAAFAPASLAATGNKLTSTPISLPPTNTLTVTSIPVLPTSIIPTITNTISAPSPSETTVPEVAVEPWIKKFPQPVDQVGWTPDGTILITVDWDALRLWKISDKQLLQTVLPPNSLTYEKIVSFAVDPDGKTIATGSFWGSIDLWDVTTGSHIVNLRPPTQNGAAATSFDQVISMIFSPNGKFLFTGDGNLTDTGSTDNAVRMWDVTKRIFVKQFVGHTDSVTGIAVNPQGTLLATSSKDSKVYLWDIETGNIIQTLSHSVSVNNVMFSKDGSTIISAGDNGLIQLWNAVDGKFIMGLEGHLDDVLSIDITMDGTLLASGARDGSIIIWSLPDGKFLKELDEHTKRVMSVSFSPNGKFLASGSSDENVVVVPISP